MGYIKETCKDKIIEAAHIEEVIGDFVELKKSGANYKGFSPFTEEKSPSFLVSPVKQIFKCFSSGKGGNAITFLMEKKGFTYPEALKYIADKYNIPLEYEEVVQTEQQVKRASEKEILRKVLTLVHALYCKNLELQPEHHPSKLEVIGKRKYNDDVILDWGIGHAPDNFLYDKLKASGYEKEGEALGLIGASERGNVYDKYSNRVIYPIHDRNGLLIGLAGRDVSGREKSAKWINPNVDAKNILYNKSRVWFGLHKAKLEIRKRGEAFITEGYNDVIAWHRYGLPNTVASCGTAITDEQINELKKLCDKVVFTMDPDKAGLAAVIKQIPRFIKEGFKTEVVILDLDPDDFVRQYEELIVLSGGLNNLFNAPGTRKDGFSLLIDEYIKKPFKEQEDYLKAERIKLKNFYDFFVKEKQDLKYDVEKLECDFLESKATLKQLELQFDKKHESYIEQNKTVASLKASIDLKKHQLKNHKESAEYLAQSKKVEQLNKQFNQAFEDSEIERNTGAKFLCSHIVNVKDDAFFNTYLNWLQTESKVSKTILNGWIKELRKDDVQEVQTEEVDYDDAEYELPKGVKEKLEDLLPNIKNYGLFMANKQIFVALPPTNGKVYFSAVSNFEIEVLQHMNDEKFPRRLIRMKNIKNKEVVFDTPHESINSPQLFDNMVTAHGNFRFDGDRKSLLRLRTFLMDQMGDGSKVDVLGWQKEDRIWVWNNRIQKDDGSEIEMNENGMFIHNGKHFYIPSANKIYRSNNSKFKPQKQFIVLENKISFNSYMQKVFTVHRDHAISGLLFAIASLFQDLIVDENKAFPILFMYGPGSSGKDGLIRCIQSFAGIQQSAISLEGDVSTAKGQIRKFAQFRNSFVHLSEYYQGNGKLDGMLKGMWDRIGYEKGNIESAVSTESVDIESSVLLSGNQFPNKEALITRMVWNEMTKTQFTEDEMKEYDELNDMTNKGVSGYSYELLKYRNLFEEEYSKKYRIWKALLQEKFKEPKARIIGNLAVLATTFQLIRDNTEFVFPFSQDDMLNHFGKEIKNQMIKMNTASIIIRFWHCFISALRGNVNDRIQVGYIVNIEGNILYFNWTQVYTQISKQWFLQYREACPALATLKDEIEKAGLITENKKTHSFDKGREANRTSAVGINLSVLPEETREDIIGYILFQKNEGTIFHDELERKQSGQEALPLDKLPAQLYGDTPF